MNDSTNVQTFMFKPVFLNQRPIHKLLFVNTGTNVSVYIFKTILLNL